MRETLSGLTTRGRAFAAAGAVACIVAILIDQPTLARVGVLVLALPLVSSYLVGRARYRLALVRSVSPQVVPAGRTAAVRLQLTNEGRTPAGVLLLEDQIPYVLGTKPRFLLDGIRHGWQHELTYQVRSDLRGRFPIGPMTVRVSDPFGLVELGHSFHTVTAMTVTPRTVALSPIPLAGAWSGSGDNRPRAFATGSSEDVTIRDYRRGDDLRRVHWRTSARLGELMVRREEQPWQSRVTVILDDRARAHRGRGVASSLETAVHAAASIVTHLDQRGYTVRLVTASEVEGSAPWHAHGPGQDCAQLLETLAVVGASDQAQITTSWLGDHNQGDLVVAVLGDLSDRDQAVLTRVRNRASSGVAIILDTATWTTTRQRSPGTPASAPATPREPGEEVRSAAQALSRQGWRTTTVTAGDRFDQAWDRLAATSSGTGGRG